MIREEVRVKQETMSHLEGIFVIYYSYCLNYLMEFISKDRKIIILNYFMWRVFKFLRFPHRDLPEIHGNYKCYQFLPPANPFIMYSAKYIRVIWGLGYIKDNGLGCFIKMSHFFPPTDYVTVSESPDCGHLTLQSICSAWMPIYLLNSGPI